jgi:hypothetical protein
MRALRRTAAAAALAVTLVLSVAPTAALAQEGETPTDRWAVQPSGPDGPGPRPNFAYSLSPGASIEDVVSLSNLSERPLTFLIYAKDAYNTPRDAAFALQADEEEPMGVGSWVRFLDEGTGQYGLESLQYTLEPGRRVDVPFLVTVPADAEPGDHAGGIIAASTEPVGGTDDDGVALAIRQRIGSRVYLRVDGPMRANLEVTNVSIDHSMPIVPWVTGRGDMAITYEVRNTGNVRLESAATVEVTGLFGRRVRSFPVEGVPELLPGSSVVLTQAFSGLSPLELLNTRIEVESLDGQTSTSRSTRTFIWSWVVVALALAAAVYAGDRYRRRRHARRLAAAAESPTTESLVITPGSEVPAALAEGAAVEVEEPVGQ